MSRIFTRVSRIFTSSGVVSSSNAIISRLLASFGRPAGSPANSSVRGCHRQRHVGHRHVAMSYLKKVLERLEKAPEFLSTGAVAQILEVETAALNKQRSRGSGPPFEQLPGCAQSTVVTSSFNGSRAARPIGPRGWATSAHPRPLPRSRDLGVRRRPCCSREAAAASSPARRSADAAPKVFRAPFAQLATVDFWVSEPLR